jgi:uncharacterized protein (DUF1684 family)
MNNWTEWVAARTKNFANPTGFLAVTSMNWLTTEPQSFSDVEGEWWAEDHKVFSRGFTSNDIQSFDLKPGSEISLPAGDGVLEVASRHGAIILRPRSPHSELFAKFDGVRVFDYNPKYAVEATLECASKAVAVGSLAGDTKSEKVSPGELVFELDGQICRITAFETANPDQLSVMFRDASNGVTTYGTGRNLTANRLENGNWSIDFNFAQNYPCSYTDFATCPIVPLENRLAVSVEAGEKTPAYRSTDAGLKQQD